MNLDLIKLALFQTGYPKRYAIKFTKIAT